MEHSVSAESTSVRKGTRIKGINSLQSFSVAEKSCNSSSLLVYPWHSSTTLALSLSCYCAFSIELSS